MSGTFGNDIWIEYSHVLKLGERRWDLQAQLKDLLLALEADILGPLNETAQVYTVRIPSLRHS
jgi:hypothetical protein